MMVMLTQVPRVSWRTDRVCGKDHVGQVAGVRARSCSNPLPTACTSRAGPWPDRSPTPGANETQRGRAKTSQVAVSRWFCVSTSHGRRRSEMLETIAVILIVLWLLGLVSSYTMGGFIHALLVIAVVVILVRVIRGGRL